ncbi:unnamed protein product [Linum trigynum]|uniref:Uncharacterized protein n=1 Tax=Linum trigynum TaxID=586398 RepID=A0AAV2ERD4_9ROSI
MFRKRKLDAWGDGEPPSLFKKDSSTEKETTQGSPKRGKGVATPIEQLKTTLVAASNEGKARPQTRLEFSSLREEKMLLEYQWKKKSTETPPSTRRERTATKEEAELWVEGGGDTTSLSNPKSLNELRIARAIAKMSKEECGVSLSLSLSLSLSIEGKTQSLLKRNPLGMEKERGGVKQPRAAAEGRTGQATSTAADQLGVRLWLEKESSEKEVTAEGTKREGIGSPFSNPSSRPL